MPRNRAFVTGLVNNFNRVMMMAGMRLGIPEALTLMGSPAPMRQISHRHSRGRAEGSRDRLHPGRSSSVRKMQRWLNEGVIVEPPPDEKARMRHAWYRRQKALEALRASLPAANVHPDYHTETQRKEAANV